ncbi:MAG: lipopolysaccharide kinase InaA family protein [Candidatus Micrarchaeota archaeon]
MPKRKLERFHVGESSFVVLPEFSDVFKSVPWKLPKPIRLVGKTFNRVERTRIDDEHALVFKSGTSRSVSREFKNYLILNSLGLKSVKTLYPAGYQLEKGRGFLYTVLEEGVIPLRSINFQGLKRDERRKSISRCAELIAELHSRGITHNDLKLKNILYHPKTNDYFIVDVSRMNRSQKEPSERARFYDLLTFLGNSKFHGLIEKKRDVNHFLEQYLRFMNGSKTVSAGRMGEKRRKTFQKLREHLQTHSTDKNIMNLLGFI